jgi:glycine cleavage system regulatory protein
MTTLVLTLLGQDRAGLVSAVSRVISEHDGSWERSQMAHLAGTFAGIVEVSCPAAQVEALVAGIEELAAQGLRITVERAGDGGSTASEGRRLSLHLVGADRPGIVAEVTTLLAGHGVNVEELSTRVVDAAMAGGTLFEADAVVGVPAGVDVAALETALEALADELMVDLDFAESPQATE